MHLILRRPPGPRHIMYVHVSLYAMPHFARRIFLQDPILAAQEAAREVAAGRASINTGKANQGSAFAARAKKQLDVLALDQTNPNSNQKDQDQTDTRQQDTRQADKGQTQQTDKHQTGTIRMQKDAITQPPMPPPHPTGVQPRQAQCANPQGGAGRKLELPAILMCSRHVLCS
jgi:hypothetical protein